MGLASCSLSESVNLVRSQGPAPDVADLHAVRCCQLSASVCRLSCCNKRRHHGRQQACTCRTSASSRSICVLRRCPCFAAHTNDRGCAGAQAWLARRKAALCDVCGLLPSYTAFVLLGQLADCCSEQTLGGGKAKLERSSKLMSACWQSECCQLCLWQSQLPNQALSCGVLSEPALALFLFFQATLVPRCNLDMPGANINKGSGTGCFLK